MQGNLELNFFKRVMLIWNVGALIISVIFFIPLFLLGWRAVGLGLAHIFAFDVLVTIYPLYRYIYIKKNIKKMKVYVVRFGQPDHHILFRAFSYQVLFKLEDGTEKFIRTTHMFSYHPLDIDFYFTYDFTGKKMNIAYDSKKNRIVVLSYYKEPKRLKQIS